MTEPARRSVTVLFFVFGVSLGSWVSRVPTIEHAAHLNNAQLGLALLGQPVGQILATLLAPQVAARLPSSWTGRLAAVASCGVVVLLGVCGSLLALLCALLAYGLTLGTLDIAMNIQAVAVQRAYGRSIMSGIHGVYNFGVLVGSLLGAIAASAGLSPTLHFSIIGGLLVPLILIGTRELIGPEADQASEQLTHSPTDGPGPRLLSHPILLAIGAIGFCALFAEGAVDNWAAVFLHQTRHASLGVAPLGTAVCGIGMAVGRFSGDAIISRWGLLPTLVCSSLLAAAGMALAVTGGTVVTALIGFTIFGLGAAAIVPIVMTAGGTVRGVPPGWSLSHVAALSYAGQTTSPALIGFVAHATSLSAAMATTLLLLLAIGPLSRIALRRPD